MFSIGSLPRDTRHETSDLFRFVFFRNNSANFGVVLSLFFYKNIIRVVSVFFKKTTRR